MRLNLIKFEDLMAIVIGSNKSEGELMELSERFVSKYPDVKKRKQLDKFQKLLGKK